MLLEAALMYDRRVAALMGEEEEPAQGTEREERGSSGAGDLPRDSVVLVSGQGLLEPQKEGQRRPVLPAAECFPRLLFIVTGMPPH